MVKEEIVKNLYWDEKPIWCQPWSIILTGILICLSGIYIFNNYFIKIFVVIIISFWWYLFLYIAPRAYQDIANTK